MISQHIYSRCLEGYFSKSAVNADSTTVTIGMDMFRREEQAQRIATECEKISTLEDIRPVPTEVQGAYRGVLRIRRLNRQITLVGRGYRLHSNQSGQGGEFRDFTFASNYLVAGEDRERFLKHPEYALNIQDFEPFPSIAERIEESRLRGNNGRIEASTKYSLFNSECSEANPQVFARAGFTRELFVDYISSILQRVSNMHYEGHENDKVLVILPQQFNVPWVRSGGNRYAEEVLVATYKILPEVIRGQLSAMTGGMRDPGAGVLRGFQLIFMEPGSTAEWRRSEYSIIDLDRQESYVSSSLDREYAEFLWDNLMVEDARKSFERQYNEMFVTDETVDSDHGPEKFSLVLSILEQEKIGYADDARRNRILVSVIEDCKNTVWTDRALEVARAAFIKELQNPTYSKGQEERVLWLVSGENCPADLQEPAVSLLLQNILNGEASAETVNWICEQIAANNAVVRSKVQDANAHIRSNDSYPWHQKVSLKELYLQICGSTSIAGSDPIKQETVGILSGWYRSFVETQDWQNSSEILKILAQQLDDRNLVGETRRGIYEGLFYLLFVGEENSRKEIAEILKKEEKALTENDSQMEVFWKCFYEQAAKGEGAISDEVLWQLSYLAIARDADFLNKEWQVLYGQMVMNYGGKYPKQLFEDFRSYFSGWYHNVQDETKQSLILQALSIVECINFQTGRKFGYYQPEIADFQASLELMKSAGNVRESARILYTFYHEEPSKEKQKDIFIRELSREQRCEVLLYWMISEEEDEILKSALPKFGEEHRTMLEIISRFTFESERELSKAAQVYFYLLQCHVKEVNGTVTMEGWCNIYEDERKEMERLSVSSEFVEKTTRFFQKLLRKTDLATVQDLTMKNVRFLMEAGVLPLGEELTGLDLMGELFSMKSGTVSEEFLNLREKMIPLATGSWKLAFLKALEEKRQALERDGEKEELYYNVLLFEEQMTNEEDFSIRNVAQRDGSSANLLILALRLLYVIRMYGNRGGRDAFDCFPVRQKLLKLVIQTAKSDPKQFADQKIAKAYRQLTREEKLQLEQYGMKESLRELSKEWQEAYGVVEERGISSIVIPLVTAVIVAALGVALNVVYYLNFADKNSFVWFVIALVLVGVGVLGILGTLIWMFVSGSRGETGSRSGRR